MKHEFTKNYALIYASGLINKRDPRDYIKYIKVEDNTAYATDSKALIRFPLCVDDGYYEIVKKTKCQTHIRKVKELSEVAYPSGSRILDARSDYSKMDDFRELNYYLDDNLGLSTFTWDFILQGENKINIKYLNFLDCLKDDFSVFKRKDRPYIIESDKITIAIMSIYEG